MDINICMYMDPKKLTNDMGIVQKSNALVYNINSHYFISIYAEIHE